MERMLNSRQTALMLAAVFFATFMDGIDGSIVNVALPDIGSDFYIDTATVSWISIIYMMILAGTLVTFARISADTGVRKILAAGFAVFTFGSLMCGLSYSFELLMVSRTVQAVGAGMMAAAGPMCCTEHLPAHKLGFGLSIVTIGASTGFAIGPALGGFIVEFTNWHWIFLINVPIGIVVTPLILKAIPADAETGGRIDIDVRGAVLLFCAITLVTFAIEILSYESMRLISVSAMILGLAVLAGFVRAESSLERPLLKLGMFRDWQFSAIFVCLMTVNMVFMGVIYLVPFFGEICMGLSSSTIGIYLLISAMVTAVFGMPFAKLSDTLGRRPFCVASGLLLVASMMLLALFGGSITVPVFITVMVLMGLSWACVGGPMASRLVEHAGDERDMASSLTNEAYYIGGAIGVALCAMVFTQFSGTAGIDIQDVTASAFEMGFVAAAVTVGILSAVLALLSLAVRDQ